MSTAHALRRRDDEVPRATEVLCEAVREEIRRCALFNDGWEPRAMPPMDLQAEEEVLSAMACDHLPPSWLRAEHFYRHFHAALFVLWSTWLRAGRRFAEEFEVLTDQTVAILERQGLGVPRLRGEVSRLTLGVPCFLPVRYAAARVVRLACLRNARAACHRLAFLLSDAATSDDELVRLHDEVGESLAAARVATSGL